MTRGPIDRPHAAMYARVAQAAAVMLLAAGGALAAWGLPNSEESVIPLTVPVIELPQAAAESGAILRPVDFQGVAERLSLVSNSPKPPAVVVTDTPPDVPPPPALERRYLGLVNIGPLSMALLVEGDKQRFVKVGDKLAEGAVVEQISEERVTLRTDAGRVTLELVRRQGAILSVAAPAVPVVGSPMKTAAPPPSMKQNNMIQTQITPPSAGKRRRGTPDGSPERFQEIMAEQRASGKGDEATMQERAKEQFETEMMKRGGRE